MSIYEYDEEKHIRMEREEAKAEGFAEGIFQGRTGHLEEQVKKKLSKAKSPEQIADELEEDIVTIQDIISKIESEE